MRRKRMRASLVLAVAAGAGESANVSAEELEEIIVTGTRIARPDFVSASPILSVTAQRFEDTGANTVEDVLNTMPQFVPAFGSTSNNPGNGGQANLSLRGLPPTSTLVLVDGRRLMPANGTGVTDVNVIPPSLVESVEVITGGASAVYGSDAIAGVVNFRLRHDFDGVELDAMGGVTDHGDGEDYAFGITAGTNFADGRGSVLGYAGHYSRELVTYADRGFSRYALTYVALGQGTLGPGRSFVAGGSPNIEEGSAQVQASPTAFNALFASYGYPPAQPPPYQTGFGFNNDGTLFTTGQGVNPPEAGAVANFRGERDPVLYNDRIYGYNFATANALQLPLDRTSMFGRGEFSINESANLYLQALYADYSVSTQLAPTGLMFVTAPVSNPYVSDDLATLLASRSTPGAPFRFIRRMSELGPRLSEKQYDVYQVTLGSHGVLAAGWRYEAYVQVGSNDLEETQANNVLRSKVEELTFAADGGVAICGGFNPFGRGMISPECAAYVAANGANHTSVEQRIVEFSATGPTFSLPAGDVQLAVGAMYKEDEFSYRADDIATAPYKGRADIVGFSASDDVDGQDANTDFYIEAALPIFKDAPSAQSLEAVLGYRWADYDSAGGVSAYKAELLYQPFEPVRLRGSFQHAVRAPSIYELYSPQLGPDVVIGEDPCNYTSDARNGANAAQVEDLCVAHGVPADLLPIYLYQDIFAAGVSGGNPDLDVEQADTYTLGIVLSSRATSRWLERLQVSVDWYQIEVTDAIVQVPAGAAVERCYEAEFNPTFSLANPYCTFFGRDPETGEIRDATEIYRNIGLFRTSGLDMQLDWSVDLGPGRFGVNWLVAYVDSFERSAGPGVPAEELAGYARGYVMGTLPEWKWNLRADYSVSSLNVGLQWRYVDSMIDGEQPDFEIPSRDYLDLFVGFDVNDGPFAGVSLHAGAENVTDADPPIFPTYVQANTDPSQYDTLGRRYFARLKYRF